MELDDELCLCFHVSRRKIENFIRRTNPQRPSQLSECLGAGTGCGWCRPFLKRLWQRAQPSSDARDRKTSACGVSNDSLSSETSTSDQASKTSIANPTGHVTEMDNTDAVESVTALDYARQRAKYRQQQDEIKDAQQ